MIVVDHYNRDANKTHDPLRSASSGFALVCLYAIQMGSHTDSKSLAPRLLTLTTSMLTLLLFVYYANDITADITAGMQKKRTICQKATSDLRCIHMSCQQHDIVYTEDQLLIFENWFFRRLVLINNNTEWMSHTDC